MRGLTVDAWIVADEAARLNDEMIAAFRPMRARRPQARFAMLSTAWSVTDPFWRAWSDGDASWTRLKATGDQPGVCNPAHLAEERRALGAQDYDREYLGIPTGAHSSPFTWDLYWRAAGVTPDAQTGAPEFKLAAWPSK